MKSVNSSTSKLEPFVRGFWCSDETIRYPSQHETVGAKQLFFIVILLPIAIISTSELIAAKHQWPSNLKGLNGNIDQTSSQTASLIYNIGMVTISWLYCLFLNALVTEYIKISVGRLRPTFYHGCRPNISCENPINQGVYLTNFSCSVDLKAENYLRVSFPSGHTSYSASSMVFLIIYLTKRFSNCDGRVNHWKYQITFLQIILFLTCISIGVSRVAGNVHHWEDVLAGLLIGSIITIFCTFIWDRIEKEVVQDEKLDENRCFDFLRA
uniref:Phosphatidic acid phosphatase type 2/haloperoxidase domain-containing protein n=1 Tax=Tetranychus urticae TaxID=32264 RepID=T1K9H6_TETUR